MIVAISGKSGCGNTTVSRLLAQRLGVRLVNYTFRNIAAERGVGLAEIIEAARGDDWYDIHVDTRQVELAHEADCVIGSRLAIWKLPDATLRVYLTASAEVRAERIRQRPHGQGPEGGDRETVLAFTLERDSQDHARYKRLYGLDNDDYSFADLVINTELFLPPEVVDIIAIACARTSHKLR
ncbi:MAG TPA: cytidylate kinase family protein [Rectinemataceae bacterium]|nr:cytidylate kinase family protein [Rectinemataceae bacterium]